MATIRDALKGGNLTIAPQARCLSRTGRIQTSATILETMFHNLARAAGAARAQTARLLLNITP